MSRELSPVGLTLANALRMAATGELSKIPELLGALEVDVQQVELDLAIRGKSLEEANREQPELYFKYNFIYQKLKAIAKMIDCKIDHAKSLKYKNYKSGSNVSLNTTDLNQWVTGEKDIQAMYTVAILLDEYLYQYDAIVKAFEMRGYSLKNVTESRINAVNSMVIT